MDLSLKPCKTLRDGDQHRDRISSLPDELLSQILSFLPTKDAAVMSVLSRKMSRVFCWRRSLDFDDSPIHHCCHHSRRLIECFPTFQTFVNSVLRQQKVCQQPLTRFSLRFGGNWINRHGLRSNHWCGQGCFPDANPSQLYAWMCFPLARRVRELDLCIHVKNPVKLPSAIFTCESLEVLKLDVGLEIDQEFSIFALPNLKVFELYSAFILDDRFLTRLVSSCPSLEDLTVKWCSWAKGDFISISSPSLRRLDLNITFKEGDQLKNGEFVHIDAPNLLYFHYVDNIACRYSVTPMNALVMAEICTLFSIQIVLDYELASFRNMLSLVKTLSNVEHLTLWTSCIEALDFGRLKDQLPMFHNLKYLELGYTMSIKWDQVLVEFLNSSPFLETLAFPQGLSFPQFPSEGLEDRLALELESQCWRTTRAIPPCCRSHLRKIVIKDYCITERELDLVKFLMRITLILEELVIYLSWSRCVAAQERMASLESTLKALPRASISCSITINLQPRS